MCEVQANKPVFDTFFTAFMIDNLYLYEINNKNIIIIIMGTKEFLTSTLNLVKLL